MPEPPSGGNSNHRVKSLGVVSGVEISVLPFVPSRTDVSIKQMV